jgi:hypothetical protein
MRCSSRYGLIEMNTDSCGLAVLWCIVFDSKSPDSQEARMAGVKTEVDVAGIALRNRAFSKSGKMDNPGEYNRFKITDSLMDSSQWILRQSSVKDLSRW